MDKISQWMVIITIIETWTITWADGEESTVVYRSRRHCAPLPACPPDDRRDENDLEPIAQVAGNESLGASTDETG
jgi:hypothetical protein